jgi:hypothetical protein
MNLSNKALTELKEALRIDIGDVVDSLTQTELEEFGDFVLTVMAESLKIRDELQR